MSMWAWFKILRSVPPGNLPLLWHDRGIHGVPQLADKFYVAAFLSPLDKANGLQPPFDLAEWQRLKPPQPLPQSC